MVVLPCLVGAGALIGSVLRKLSRLAQEQVISSSIIIIIFVRTAQCIVSNLSFTAMSQGAAIYIRTAKIQKAVYERAQHALF